MRDLLTIVILTRDEEVNLPVCLDSVRPLDARVLVIDSGSADRTQALARERGCEVVEHEFVNQAQQLNWALDNVPISTPWVLRLDADERLTPELADELREKLPLTSNDVTAYWLKRRVYFWGRWIRHGGFYPTWLLRLWRAGKARSEQREMDEHMLLLEGRSERLRSDFIDENQKGVGFLISKHNDYADREVRALLEAERNPSPFSSLGGQAGRKRWLRERVYGNAPLFARAAAYWALRYFVLLGFLDGRPGLVFHFLQGFWYRFLIDAKLMERQRMQARCQVLLQTRPNPSPDATPPPSM